MRKDVCLAMFCKFPSRLWSVAWLAVTMSCKEWGYEKVSGRTHLWVAHLVFQALIKPLTMWYVYEYLDCGSHLDYRKADFSRFLVQDPAGVIEAGSF